MINLTKRQFQITFGFWFAVATLNGFCGGFAVAWLTHYFGWWS